MTEDKTMKYYYIDPLTAAWIAKHFAVKFKLDIEVYNQDTEEKSIVTDQVGTILAMRSERAYIHPDSQHLLNDIPYAKKIAMKLLGLWPEGSMNDEAAYLRSALQAIEYMLEQHQSQGMGIIYIDTILPVVKAALSTEEFRK